MNVNSIASLMKPDMLASRLAMLKVSENLKNAERKIVEEAMNIYLPETVDGTGAVDFSC